MSLETLQYTPPHNTHPSVLIYPIYLHLDTCFLLKFDSIKERNTIRVIPSHVKKITVSIVYTFTFIN